VIKVKLQHPVKTHIEVFEIERHKKVEKMLKRTKRRSIIMTDDDR